MRRDDGVGPWVAAGLAARGWPAGIHAGDGMDLIGRFDVPHLVVIDATRSGAAPGTRVTLDGATPLPRGVFAASSHLFGLAEAVETARALGLLPRRLTVHGIEGAEFGFGSGLSPAVEIAAAALLAEICRTDP